jgi:hypothetical protein
MSKKLLIILTLSMGMIFAETSARLKKDKAITSRNLRVLPKNTSDEDVIRIMRNFSKSLGVKCTYCHVEKVGEKTAEGHPVHDFASDDKEMKKIARKMMRMTEDINDKLDDIGDHNFEPIACITCHRGNTHPSLSLDSVQRTLLK